MLLFWRKNRLKVRSIRRFKENGNEKYVYLPISVLLEKLNQISEHFPDNFKYEIRKYSEDAPGYAEGVSILLHYKDKKLFNFLQNDLVLQYCGKYEFTFNCERYEWQVL